jgi:hypothetical protein
MAEMGAFLVGVRGELTEEQTTALALAGVAVEKTSYAGYGGELDPMRTYLHVIADEESEARTKIAGELNVDAADLTVRPHPGSSG